MSTLAINKKAHPNTGKNAKVDSRPVSTTPVVCDTTESSPTNRVIRQEGSKTAKDSPLAKIAYGALSLAEYQEARLTPPLIETPVFDELVRRQLGA